MSLKALTANTAPEENAHLLAEDDAAIFQSMFGEDGVLEIGQRMKATVISNNKVRVADGVVCIGGHIARTVYGDYTDLTIENGESGKNRNDLIIGTFSTTGAGGIDTMQLTVKKGAAGTAATDPALTQGNLYTGSKLREVPLWRVKIEGLSITKVEQLFEIVPSIPTLKKELESLNGKLEDLKNPNNYAWVVLQSRTLPGSKETYLLAESLTSAVDFASATKGSAAIYIKKPGRYLIMSRINIETTSPNVLLRINRRQSAESAYTAYREIGIQKNAGEYSQMTLLTTYDTNTAFGIIIKNNSPSDCNVGESVICIIPI